MTARETVAHNVRRLRVARGVSAEMLAADAQMDKAYLSQIERGLGNPTVDMLEKLAGALEVELGEFFTPPGDVAPKPLRAGRKPKN